MSAQEHAISLVRSLPQPLLAELIDFAEFLQFKNHQKPKSNGHTLQEHVGKLIGSPHFNEDPVKLQKEWRNEWN